GFGAVAGGGGPLAFRVGAAARETDDYDTPLGQAPNSWTSFRAYSAGGALVGEPGFAGVAVKRTENEYGLPPGDPSEPGGHIELEQTRVETRGDARIAVGPFKRLDFGAQHSDYEHTEFEGDGAPGTRFTSAGWEARVEAHHRGERVRGALGLQFIDVDFAAEGGEAFITPSNTQDMGAFVIERWNSGAWGLEGGARFERREIVNEGGGARDFDTASLSTGVFFRPVENWFVGATLARTQRAPTAIELFAEGPHLATANYEIGDPLLDKEAATSIEASARHEAGRLRFEASLYRVDFEDYVGLVQRGDVFWLDEATETSGFAPDASDPSIPAGAEVLPVFVFTQQDARFSGGEISLRAPLFEAGGFQVSGDVAYDVVRAEFASGGRPPRIPPSSLTIGVDAENAHWRGRLEAAHVGDQDRLAAFETPTQGYTFVNAGIAFRPDGEEGALTLRLDGRNLTDEEGRVHASFLKDELPLPGRNLRFSVASSF
ncbi:MAG TPA: TonB-dependent receptor, partial [Hyphomonadaceae bacterium]|nr:TonB-dependent receptor [Hyphomonadaceae bacterium]